MKIPIKPRTNPELEAIPNPILANQPEAVPWQFYDQQTYVDATTTQLTFFTATNNDRTLSNMQAAGQITDPNYFEIYCFGCDVLRDVTTAAGAQVGALDDLQLLLLTGRPTWTFNMSDKQFGPFPLLGLHAQGGAIGFGWGTFTAEESIQYANNSYPDGGFGYVGGALVIPPKVAFDVTVRWNATVNLTADVALRMWMFGVLHRRVL